MKIAQSVVDFLGKVPLRRSGLCGPVYLDATSAICSSGLRLIEGFASAGRIPRFRLPAFRTARKSLADGLGHSSSAALTMRATSIAG